MFNCAQCSKPEISWWDNFRANKQNPAKCSNCGCNQYRSHWLSSISSGLASSIGMIPLFLSLIYWGWQGVVVVFVGFILLFWLVELIESYIFALKPLTPEIQQDNDESKSFANWLLLFFVLAICLPVIYEVVMYWWGTINL